MSPPSAKELAYEYWREWLDSPELSEDTLMLYTASLTGTIQRAMRHEDYATARRVEYFFHYIKPYCRLEPLISRFESSLMLMHLCFASAHLVRGQLAESADRLANVRALLAEINERRERMELDPRPNTETKVTYLIYAATIVFEAHEYATYGLEPPEQMLEAFWPLHNRVLTWIETHNWPDPSRAYRLLEAQKLCEFELIKMAFSVCRELIDPFIAHFNRFYEDQLDCELRHYADLDYRQGSWCFWDFEVHKLFEMGQLNYTDLVICSRARTRALQQQFNRAGLPERLRVLERYDQRMLAALNPLAPAAPLRPPASSAARN